MHDVALIRGEGIGPEVTTAVLRMVETLQAPVNFVEVLAGQSALEAGDSLLPDATIDAIRACGVLLKGPLRTPMGAGFRSINVTLRQQFDLYANMRPVRSFEGVPSRYSDVNLVVVRENTEGLYVGRGRRLGEGISERAESVSIVTRAGAERIVRAAFEYAVRNKRRKVTAVHKANILKLTSGLFLETAREVAAFYPSIEFEDMTVGSACMELVLDPQQFDVIVTTNLIGDILSDLGAGLVGGLGLTPGANIGLDTAMFEAVHGTAPDIAGQDKANPTGMALAASMMLHHLGLSDAAHTLSQAIKCVLADGTCITADVGGTASTSEFATAVCEQIAKATPPR